jgi:ABC-type dipeptide/oligopeptide/nickel transport system permease subunit
LHPYFGRIRRIEKAKIFTIRLIKEPSFLSFLGFGDQRRVIITTIQATYDMDLSHFAKEEEISEYFQNLAEAIEDEYYTTFRRIHGDNRAIVRNLFSDRLASIGILIICIYVFFALWGVASMLLFPSNSLYSNALFLKNPEWIPMSGDNVIFHPPSGEYLFGTDFLGRDLFARMVYGTTFTLFIAMICSSFMMLLVILFGYSSSMLGGWWDYFVGRLADVFQTFPPFVPIILFASIPNTLRSQISGGFFLYVFIGLSFFTWAQGSIIINSEIKSILDSDYVRAAQSLGASKFHILRHHVVPKTTPTLLYIYIYAISDIILAMTMISIIGLGSESTLTWGSDLEKAIGYTENIFDTWWTLLFPTIWISGIIIGLILLGDRFRDALSGHGAVKGRGGK